MRSHYRRHLPHHVPTDFPIFLTWNLKGAMPREAAERLRSARDQLERQPLRPGETLWARVDRHEKILFGLADELLAKETRGPFHLKDPDAAQIVEDAILFGVLDRYDLFAWCVMANHVHVIHKANDRHGPSPGSLRA